MYDSTYLHDILERQNSEDRKNGLTKMGTAEFIKVITVCSGHTTTWFVKTHRTVYYKKWILCKLYQLRNDKKRIQKNITWKENKKNKVTGVLKINNPINKTRRKKDKDVIQ